MLWKYDQTNFFFPHNQNIFLHNLQIPNVLGLIFGVLQMVLHCIYKDKKKVNLIEEQKLPSSEQIKADVDKLDTIVLTEVQVVSTETNNNVNGTEKETEKEKENIPDDQIARPQTNHSCVINMDSPAINQSPAVSCGA